MKVLVSIFGETLIKHPDNNTKVIMLYEQWNPNIIDWQKMQFWQIKAMIWDSKCSNLASSELASVLMIILIGIKLQVF